MSDPITVTCPSTGQTVSTEIAAPASAHMEGNSFRCPACGQMHTWDKPAGETMATIR